MLSDVQRNLEKAWVFGFQHLRIADSSENENGVIIYAVDFQAKEGQTIGSFLTELGQKILRLTTRFTIVSASIEFEDRPFAIVEFREK